MKKKLNEIELQIQKFISPNINLKDTKFVSYSQFSIYQQCPHRYNLKHIEKKEPFITNINLVFGTALHETLQKYIEVIYGESKTKANKMDLEALFHERFSETYRKEYENNKDHFSTASQMREFYDDGVAILEWIKKKCNVLFTVRNVKLLGIELPLISKVANNIYYKAYIDFALYDEDLNKVYIYDIKTSTRGWKDEKKDDIKIAQILLYKEFFSKQYGFDIENIEVEFFVVRRKIYEDSEFTIPRVQEFKPPSGKIKRKQTMDSFDSFLKDCFDENGKYQIKTYNKNVGEKSCKWCPFRDKPDLCDKTNI